MRSRIEKVKLEMMRNQVIKLKASTRILSTMVIHNTIYLQTIHQEQCRAFRQATIEIVPLGDCIEGDIKNTHTYLGMAKVRTKHYVIFEKVNNVKIHAKNTEEEN